MKLAASTSINVIIIINLTVVHRRGHVIYEHRLAASHVSLNLMMYKCLLFVCLSIRLQLLFSSNHVNKSSTQFEIFQDVLLFRRESDGKELKFLIYVF
jgi:hypothetical protein